MSEPERPGMHFGPEQMSKIFLTVAGAAGIAMFGWIWNTANELTVARMDISNMKTSHASKFEELDSASAKAIERVSEECQSRVDALKAATDREHESLKSGLSKVDVLAKRGDENSLALARVEVKMESVSEKLDEIKKLLE